MKKTIAMLLVLVLALGIFAGCANTTTDPTDGTKDTQGSTQGSTQGTTEGTGDTTPPESETPLMLTWQQGIGIDSLFESPHQNVQSLYPYMVFEPLAYYDAKNDKLIPALATEWEANDDFTEFTFTIREGVTWHDGEPLTAEDVVFSLNDACCNPNNIGINFCNYIVGFDEMKNGTADTLSGVSSSGNKVTVKLTTSTALFTNSLAGLWILPEHLLGDIAWADIQTSDYWKKPIGTGPYMINEVKFPDYFTVTRYDGYWGEAAGIKNAQFVSYAAGGNDAVVAAMISGDIDVTTKQAINDAAVANNIVDQNGDVKSIMTSAFAVRSFVFNFAGRGDGNNKEDLRDKKVRQAISLLLDEETVASFYSGQATPAVTLVHPNCTEYNTDVPVVHKDLAAAKKLLDEAGFDYDQTIDIAYYYADQTSADVMQLIVQDAESIGVKINPILATGDLAGVLDAKNYDIIYCAGSHTAFNQANFYNSTCSWTGYAFAGALEERGEIFDDLMNQYNATDDAVTRKELSLKMQALNYEHNYIIPLYFMNEIVCYNTENVELPEDIFAVSGSTYMKWEDWKILN